MNKRNEQSIINLCCVLVGAAGAAGTSFFGFLPRTAPSFAGDAVGLSIRGRRSRSKLAVRFFFLFGGREKSRESSAGARACRCWLVRGGPRRRSIRDRSTSSPGRKRRPSVSASDCGRSGRECRSSRIVYEGDRQFYTFPKCKQSLCTGSGRQKIL